MDNHEQNTGDIIIYQTEDGLTKINVKLDNETVWLNQQQLVMLYQSSKSNISEHIKHIFAEGELDEKSVVRKFRTTADKPFMGLTTFSGELPALKDIGIAKNYLNENELKILNNFVSGYFDLAEISALEHKPMYMSDYIRQLDSVLTSSNRPLLEGAGTISHAQALEKATAEYRKYQNNTLSPVEEAYLETVKETAKLVKKSTKSKK